jgi:excisionase family DNA binding protein
LKLAYTVAEAVDATGIGQSKLYEYMKSGQLPAKKAGGTTLILADVLRAFLEGLTDRPNDLVGAAVKDGLPTARRRRC